MTILSTTHDTTILDLPTSISHPPHLRLRSTSPPRTPYTLPEPKNPLAPSPQHLRHLPLLQRALSTSIPPYHLPRLTTPAEISAEPPYTNPTTLLLSPNPDILTLPHTGATLPDLSELYARHIANPHPTWTTLTLSNPSPAKLYHIPPHSSFTLTHLPQTSPTPTTTTDRPHDLLLLDPPWPNRSASRKKAGGGSGGGGGGSGYSTANRFDIFPLLRQLPVRERLRPGSGLLAVWVTNKPALRTGLRRLLDEDWGCEEVAEWVWVKVTVAGEPVYALESAVRKPYEVLVIARRREGEGEGESRGVKRKREEVENGGGGGVAREVTIPSKVVLAVPDVHSRKPCIKELIEPYLPTSYSACEIFGRNLTEGWHTIGDEAIKYNWDGHWGPADEMERGSQAGSVEAGN